MIDTNRASEVLSGVADILEEMGIQYWIDSGTLLGAYRDKDFIPYDHDIDIRILPNQIADERIGELVSKLWEFGFHVIVSNYGKRAEMICLNTDKNPFMLDLKFAYWDDNYLWMYCWRQPFAIDEPRVHCYPRKFFEKLTSIELRGRKYPAPSPIRKYIAHHYGEDWQEFKKRPEQAEDTDLAWDYMKDPPCSMSIKELALLRQGGADSSAVKSKNK